VSSLYFHILYEQVSTVHLQAHNHLDPHQEDEESICKPGHQDILQIERLSCSMNQGKITNYKKSKENKLTIGMPYLWGELHWRWTIWVIGWKTHNSIEKSPLAERSPTNWQQRNVSIIPTPTKGKQNNDINRTFCWCNQTNPTKTKPGSKQQ